MFGVRYWNPSAHCATDRRWQVVDLGRRDHRRLVEFVDDVMQLKTAVSGGQHVARPLGMRAKRHHDAEARGRRFRMDGGQATDPAIRPKCSRVPISDFAPPANPRWSRRGIHDRVHHALPTLGFRRQTMTAPPTVAPRAVATAIIETILRSGLPPRGHRPRIRPARTVPNRPI